MTPTPFVDDPKLSDDDRTRAGEYVLGLLEGKERVAFEAQMELRKELVREVDAWTMNLTQGYQQIDWSLALPVDSQLWNAIEVRLAAQEPRAASAGKEGTPQAG